MWEGKKEGGKERKGVTQIKRWKGFKCILIQTSKADILRSESENRHWPCWSIYLVVYTGEPLLAFHSVITITAKHQSHACFQNVPLKEPGEHHVKNESCLHSLAGKLERYGAMMKHSFLFSFHKKYSISDYQWGWFGAKMTQCMAGLRWAQNEIVPSQKSQTASSVRTAFYLYN